MHTFTQPIPLQPSQMFTLARNSTLGPDLGISRPPRTFEIELDAYGGPVALSSQAGPPLPMKVQWNRCDPTSIRTQRTFYLHIFEAPEPQFELPFRISKTGYNLALQL